MQITNEIGFDVGEVKAQSLVRAQRRFTDPHDLDQATAHAAIQLESGFTLSTKLIQERNSKATRIGLEANPGRTGLHRDRARGRVVNKSPRF